MLFWLRRRTFTLILLVPVVAAGWVIGDTFIEDDNFRVVTGDLYRSGQLRADEWRESYAEHPYRSIINLRGSGPEQAWYRRELAFAEVHGIAHTDVRLSDGIKPSLEEMDHLVAVMRAAPKPLLIHCRSGSDRSGLAAALYLLAIDKQPTDTAMGQLSLWYGHFPWLGSRTVAMDHAFAAYVAAGPSLRAVQDASFNTPAKGS